MVGCGVGLGIVVQGLVRSTMVQETRHSRTYILPDV